MSKNNLRYIARIVVEAATPLVVGSGEEGLTIDKLIARDVNGLPIIPGSALAGVFRHEYSATNDIKKENYLFGYQSNNNGEGSRIFFTNAHFVGSKGVVYEGFEHSEEIKKDKFAEVFKHLPIRQHVSIDHKGVAKDTAKYDEEVLFKGTRFCFEVEAIDINEEDWLSLLNLLKQDRFRIGSGTRKGFGALSVVSAYTYAYDFTKKTDVDLYLDKKASLNYPVNYFNPIELVETTQETDEYVLRIKADNFFLFSSGFASSDADINQVMEDIVVWDGLIPDFKKNQVLIPATSIKGAISHRVAFHYNKLKGIFAENIQSSNLITELVKDESYFKTLIDREHFNSSSLTSSELFINFNPAVRGLFGYSENPSDDKDKNRYQKNRGNVIFNDLYLDAKCEDFKVFNHVRIDRFTQGSYAGALFNEKVSGIGGEFDLTMAVNKNINSDYIKCFEKALLDIVNGILPLGGRTMLGHGMFSGKLFKNKTEISYDSL